ncbi:MAG: galactokinase [Anaerolineales bacterium]|nr:MAG: galactokinase [Anaerolineales bacterium]
MRQKFEEIFGCQPATVVRAPGRVNLIGEHTDYNDGYVLPVAIDRSILMAADPRPDRQVVLHALDFDQRAEFSLDDIRHDDQYPWSNYQRGVAFFLQERGFELPGMNAVISGDIPIGSGLSSSAAVEVAAAYAWQVLSGFSLSRVELALLCQQAENEFVGMKCGIMDQFISALGQRDHALLIDCRTLEHELVRLGAIAQRGSVTPVFATIVVCDTMKRRGLVDSEYNARRRECEEGVRLLRKHLPEVKALRDVSPAQFERYQQDLPDVVRRRCRHIVYENERVLQSVEALKGDDLATFGRLMNESHVSLRDDYQVSCRELNVMAEAAWQVEGVYGSRLTGAGFGGCTVSLVAGDAVDRFRARVAAEYQAATGVEPQIYVCAVEDGVGEASNGIRRLKLRRPLRA